MKSPEPLVRIATTPTVGRTVIGAVALAPAASLIAEKYDGHIRIYDYDADETLAKPSHGDYTWALSFSLDGNQLAAVDFGCTLRIFRHPWGPDDEVQIKLKDYPKHGEWISNNLFVIAGHPKGSWHSDESVLVLLLFRIMSDSILEVARSESTIYEEDGQFRFPPGIGCCRSGMIAVEPNGQYADSVWGVTNDDSFKLLRSGSNLLDANELPLHIRTALRFAKLREYWSNACWHDVVCHYEHGHVRVEKVHSRGESEWHDTRTGRGDRCSVVENGGRTLVALAQHGGHRNDYFTDIYWLEDIDVLYLCNEEQDLSLRCESARRIARRKYLAGAEHLVAHLYTDCDKLTQAVAPSLGQLKEPDTIPSLIRALGTHDSVALQNSIRRALNRFSLADVVTALGDALQHVAAVRRRGAMRFIVHKSCLEAVEWLCGALTDRDVEVRRLAARGLADRCHTDAIVPLLISLSDEDETVRRKARTAIIRQLDGELRSVRTRLDLPKLTARLISGRRVRQFNQEGSEGLLQRIVNKLVEINGNATTLLSSVENLRTAATSECATVVSLFIASALEAANRWRDAAALFGRAAELAREVDAIEIEWRALSCQGQCLHRAGGDRSAWKAFQAAMDVIDGQWYRLAGAEDVYRQFFADKWELYDNAVLCCLRLGYRAEALECCERGKVRYLGDLVARRHLGKVSRRKRTRHPFWRELAEAMPVRVRRHEQDVATGLVEIVAVDPEAAEAASDSSALIPVQWAALVASEDHPELQAVSRMVAVLWRMAREVTRSDDDELRDAIQQMDAVMARLLSLLESGVWPADRNEQSGISRDYRSAVGTLHSQSRRLLDEGSYWDVAEVFNSSSGDDWLVVIHAIREPLNVVLHNTPVFGTYCEGQRDKDAPTLVARSTSEHRGRSGSRLRTEFIESRLARLEQSKWSDTLALARGEVATFADIADTVRGTPDFAHVEFCVTQEGTHAWIIHSVGRSNDGEAERRLGEDRIRVIDLPDVSLEKLNTHLPWKADVVPSNMNKTLKWLSRDLWQPIDTYLQLQKIRRVRIVPHRGLHLIPFAALKSVRNKYVADDYEISLQPGASIAKICRRREPQRKYSGLTAIANPNGDLEYAETEVDSVVSWYSNESVEIVRGQDASLSRFRSMQLRETHHHAGHARYEWGDPLASGVCFADGSLTLGDLFDCTEPANDWTHTRRVVLSACETAVTDPADLADECLGLATGFLFAGVDEVVASLWPVDDLATSLLMDRFHRALHAQDGDAGPSSALALKQAQDWLRRLTWSVIRQQAPEECQSASDSQSRNLSGIPEVTGQSCCDSSTDNPHARPFQHPYFWAGFAVWSL